MKNRVFLTTSPLTTLFYLIYINQNKEKFDDYLIVVNSHMNTDALVFMKDVCSLHSWTKVIYTSNTTQEQFNVSYTKKITRKLRQIKLLKPIYSLLREKWEQKMFEKQNSWLSTTLNLDKESVCELNLLTETDLNKSLIFSFSKARINYFEHGVSDYFVFQKKETEASFFCLFNDEYSSYLNSISSEKSKNVFPFFIKNEFSFLSSKLIEKHIPEYRKILTKNTNETFSLVLMQDLENLGVDRKIHKTLINKIGQQIDKQKTILLLKPHPKQSKETIEYITDFLTKHNFSFRILNDSIFKSINIEFFFEYIKSEITHVFTFYSSGLFYLSKLYPEDRIKYMYTFDEIKNHIDKIPEDVSVIHKKFINEQVMLFNKNCINF